MKKKNLITFLIFLLLARLLPLGTVSADNVEDFERYGVKYSPDESNFVSTTVFDSNGEIILITGDKHVKEVNFFTFNINLNGMYQQ